MSTTPLFLDNTYLYAITAMIIEIGTDEIGNYFVTDRSIFFPRGGGQPDDKGFMEIDRQNQFTILRARYIDAGIRHYTEILLEQDLLKRQVVINIFPDTRKLHAAYHSSGHWISQVMMENLKLPLIAVRGDHTPGNASIEFEGDLSCVSPDILSHLRMAMIIDLQANLHIHPKLTTLDSALFSTALIPKNFKPPPHKPLRLVQLETYRPVPCGGTHVDALRDIQSVTPLDFTIKGKKAILKYQCTVAQTVTA